MSELDAGLPRSRYADIAADITAMAAADQEMRRAAVAEGRLDTTDTDADRQRLARIKEIVGQIGWPSASKVGEQAAHLAWLLVQHADADAVFQRRCLALMAELPAGEVAPRDIAYLEDRVRRNEGRPQLYGTQFRQEADGRWVPQPIEDEAQVDRRRAAVGLEPLAEYGALLARYYGERPLRP